jgi:hypothetical protein
MKKVPTLFLKTVIFLIGWAVLALCVFLIFEIFTHDIGGYFPIVIGMVIAAFPFFVGAYHTFQLLNYIDSNTAFSSRSIQTLRTIKHCAAIISVMYTLGLPYIYYVAEKDDAPGVILLGLIFSFAPMIVAVFATVLQKLLQNAIDLKSENELTV